MSRRGMVLRFAPLAVLQGGRKLPPAPAKPVPPTKVKGGRK